MKNYTERLTCRVCDSPELGGVVSLGDQAIAEWSKGPKQATVVPLEVMRCGRCSLVQLRHTTRPDLLWNENYGYRSGINKTMTDHLTEIAQTTERMAQLKRGDIVVDIGCNDGTLLDKYSPGIHRVGFDPSRGHATYSWDKLDQLFINYFNAPDYVKRYGKKTAKAITAISMFYDLENPNEFLRDVKTCLKPDGIFVVQQNYLAGMLQQTAYDNICHEHLEYYCLGTMETLLHNHGLEVFDVAENGINGGSLRTYVRYMGSTVGGDEGKQRVQEMRDKEVDLGLHTRAPYEQFAKRVEDTNGQLKGFIQEQVDDGKRVYLYGASTRSSTLLQSAGIDNRLLFAAAERNPDKWGKRTVATNIPIISEEQARKDNPDFMLIGPWFFLLEFLSREKDYLERGGKFIVPLPRFRIVDYETSRNELREQSKLEGK